VKVVREHTAPYNSRKYGYINFVNHADAETVVSKHNYLQINNKQYRLSWCDPDPSIRKTQKGNVCVKVCILHLNKNDLFFLRDYLLISQAKNFMNYFLK
jgi:RNA recognition motif-containing protein